jgi:uncharacterized membrane protein YgcG
MSVSLDAGYRMFCRRSPLSALCAMVLLLAVGILPVAGAVGADWYKATGAPGFATRYGHSALSFNNGSGEAMWVTGGDDGSFTYFSDTWYSADGTGWSFATGSSPRRSGHSSLVFDNRMWVIGGYDQTQGVNDVWDSPTGISWTLEAASPGFTNRSAQSSVVFLNSMWVIGGEDVTTATTYDDTWNSTDGIAWTQQAAPAQFGTRAGQSTVVFNNGTGDALWLIGGYDFTGFPYNDIWYSTDGVTWYLENASAGFDPRSGHTSLVYDNRIWVIGGTDNAGTMYNDVWYSDDGITWTKATGHAGFSPRYGHSSLVFDNALWVIGGYDLATAFGDVWYSSPPVPLAVTAITPARGLNTGLLNITNLAGTGFTTQTAVNLTSAGQANITATNVTMVSSGWLTCSFNLNNTLPGLWSVTVTNPDGVSTTLTNGFTIAAPPPSIIAITPSQGYNTGAVTISNLAGTNFTAGAAVKLVNTTAGLEITATNVTVSTPGKINCTLNLLGFQPGKANVTVINPDTQSATLADGFTVLPRFPTVTNVVPSSGNNTGLINITLVGNLFVEGAAVRLEKAGQNFINATNVTVNSDTNITCSLNLDSAADGTWSLNVINPGEQGNNIFQFIIYAAKSTAGNTASSGSSTGGSSGGGSSGGSGGSSGGTTVSGAALAASLPSAVPEAVTAAETGVTTELSVTSKGVVTRETSLASGDSIATVSIPAGVLAMDATGSALGSLSITPLAPSAVPADAAGSSSGFTGVAYDLGPDGATFSPAITLSFAVPEAAAGQDYTIRMLDEVTNSWADVPTTFHPESGTVTAEVSHFCCFALFARAPVTPAPMAVAPQPTVSTKPAPTPPPTAMSIFSGLVLWVATRAIRSPLVVVVIVILAIGIFWVGRRQIRIRRIMRRRKNP